MTICTLFWASLALLAPPQLVDRNVPVDRTGIKVPIDTDFALTILEADEEQQGTLVDMALEAGPMKHGGIDSSIDDPYGVVLWPAAQVVAHALTRLGDLRGVHVLELGAGTGLCSLAALARGATVLATDYREEPLQLLRESAEFNGLTGDGEGSLLSTDLFDIKCEAEPLPAPATVVVAADLLYLKSTSVALARRCVEALRSPDCRWVLVGDLGRPGRQAFLEELIQSGVRAEAAAFEPVDGWLPGAPRHELVSSRARDEAQRVSVGLLRLTPEDLTSE
jgi:predicted nicotinamide N-methyase